MHHFSPLSIYVHLFSLFSVCLSLSLCASSSLSLSLSVPLSLLLSFSLSLCASSSLSLPSVSSHVLPQRPLMFYSFNLYSPLFSSALSLCLSLSPLPPSLSFSPLSACHPLPHPPSLECLKILIPILQLMS